MPSPFPGMNPYLEHPSLWPNFHDSFLLGLRDELQRSLWPKYFVAVQHTVYIHELPGAPDRRYFKPDVTLARLTMASTATATLSRPAPGRVRIPQPVEEVRIPYLAITDKQSRRVVSVMELLSPSNKATGSDRDQYLAKRREILDSQTNLVEIDLLRGGPRLPAEPQPACAYAVLISRPATRPEADVWLIALREPLPSIPIPLGHGEVEPEIDLQSLLHRVYDAAGYALIAYDEPPVPPLRPEEQAWAAKLLA